MTLDDQGQETARTRTPFFDPNAEKLNERAVNVGDTYYFTTTTANRTPGGFLRRHAENPAVVVVDQEEEKQPVGHRVAGS